MAQSDKATATLNNLQDYRNKVYTINLQNLQYAQTLAANNQMSQSKVDKYVQNVYSSLGGATSAGTNFANTSNTAANQTTYGLGSTTPEQQITQTGQIAGRNYTKYPHDGLTY